MGTAKKGPSTPRSGIKSGRRKALAGNEGLEADILESFQTDPGQAAVDFFLRLEHIKGKWAGKPFVQEPWQERFTRKLFGTLRADGTRQYRRAALWCPRKNGKSTLAAGYSLALLMEGEPGAEVYCCGLDRGMARIIHNLCRTMVERSELGDVLGVYRDAIVHKKTESILAPLSADAASHLGKNTHACVFDEIGFMKTREFFDVMETSMGARENPLLIEISTAGIYDPEAFGWQEYERCRKVLEGTLPDPELLVEIYGLALEEDWLSEENWARVNPNLGVSFSLDFLRKQFERAQESITEQNVKRMYYLNQWQQQVTRWISIEAWKACPALNTPAPGSICYGGLDLGSTKDLTAFVLCFPESDGTYSVLCRFYLPEATAHKREDLADYFAWRDEGLVCLTPGNATDYEFVRRDIAELAALYDIRAVAFDSWGSKQVSQNLQDDGVPLVEMRQGFASMSAPTKSLERLILDGRLRHGDNAALTWQAGNAAVKIDAAENLKIVKDHSAGRVDGMVALVMALAMAENTVDVTSVYETRGLRSL